MSKSLSLSCLALLSIVGCNSGDDKDEHMMEPEPTLKTTAPLTFSLVYQSVTRTSSYYGDIDGPRAWIPMDLAKSPAGDLWVVQRLERNPAFDDDTECTSAIQTGAIQDCSSLEGSTVQINAPELAEAASDDNERSHLVSDANAWHFMRRPSAIAFGNPEVWLQPEDPGAIDPDTLESVLTEPAMYPDTFATCHEHRTGNFTDEPTPFIGPTLWTSDPDIYNGRNGRYSWSNGKHIDMLHASPYCMGLAWERDSIYWAFNGNKGSIDRYDFATPHVPGHWNHENGSVRRYELGDNAITRLDNVPSNLELHGNILYVADSGGSRVLRFDITQPAEPSGSIATNEANVHGEKVLDATTSELLSHDTLAALWGQAVEPSGLALLDDTTLVVANHGSGHIGLFNLTDGALIRNIDTGMGAGIGGVAVIDGRIYFTHMDMRSVFRVDVQQTPAQPAS